MKLNKTARQPILDESVKRQTEEYKVYPPDNPLVVPSAEVQSAMAAPTKLSLWSMSPPLSFLSLEETV